MPQLAISTLGGLRVTLDGRLVDDFRSDKTRALLAYLAVESRSTHRRESLAHLLWPESPESNARHSLSQALSDLRSILGDRSARGGDGPRHLLATRETVGLNPEGSCWVDARAFEALLAGYGTRSGRASEDEGAETPLTRAAALYQGAFLDGFSLGDAYPFEEWVLLQRERLERRAIGALRALIEARCAAADHAAALAAVWRWLELAPWQEEAHRAAIRLLALTGQRATALRQYELCARMLADEFGAEPEPETVALYRRVRDGTLAPAPGPRPGAPATHSAGRSRRHNLPAPLAPLVGRESELEYIADRLSDPACRLLTLVGPGGIGKTRLAVAAARRELQAFSDGVYLISLAQVNATDGVLAAIARALHYRATAAGPTPQEQLCGYLRNKAVLLVLDNLEHLPGAGGLAVDLLSAAPGLKVLATSRAPLGARGEGVVRVGPLSMPDATAHHVDDVSRSAAVQLFVRGAQRASPGHSLTRETAPVVAQICRAVAGVPLALLLAASWCDMLTVAEIRDRLTGGDAGSEEGALPFLRSDWRELPERQRSMWAVFDHSWQLLDDRGREVMRALGVFRGEITPDAAYYVAGATERDLRRLAEVSLLTRSDARSYDLHPLLREYAAVQLSRDRAEEMRLRERHASHYVGNLRRSAEAGRGPRQQEALEALDGQIDDARRLALGPRPGRSGSGQ